jgi:hypothetical protein
MFVEQKRLGKIFVIEIKDNKGFLLHYFDKELETLSIQVPLLGIIRVEPNDRIGYRKKLTKFFKKISEKPEINIIIGDEKFVDKIIRSEEFQNFIKRGFL